MIIITNGCVHLCDFLSVICTNIKCLHLWCCVPLMVECVCVCACTHGLKCWGYHTHRSLFKYTINNNRPRGNRVAVCCHFDRLLHFCLIASYAIIKWSCIAFYASCQQTTLRCKNAAREITEWLKRFKNLVRRAHMWDRPKEIDLLITLVEVNCKSVTFFRSFPIL